MPTISRQKMRTSTTKTKLTKKVKDNTIYHKKNHMDYRKKADVDFCIIHQNDNHDQNDDFDYNNDYNDIYNGIYSVTNANDDPNNLGKTPPRNPVTKAMIM